MTRPGHQPRTYLTSTLPTELPVNLWQFSPASLNLSHLMTKPTKWTFCLAKTDQPGHRPSLISLCCLHEETLGPQLPTEHIWRLIRLGACQGWSESSLGTHILLVLSLGGSILSPNLLVTGEAFLLMFVAWAWTHPELPNVTGKEKTHCPTGTWTQDLSISLSYQSIWSRFWHNFCEFI